MTACQRALLLVFLSAASLSAQSPARPTIDAARAGNWYLRIATSGSDTVQGRIATVRADTVRFARTYVLMSDVASIDRRIRRGGGALPAGLFGAVVFGALGAGLAGLCESDCEYAWVLPTAGGAATGMAMGAVAGALIVPGRPEWRRLYPPYDSLQARAVAREQEDQPFAGGGVTVNFAVGRSIEEFSYRIFRLGLQLGGTGRAERPVETTGEFQLIGADGAAVFYAGGGANVLVRDGAYVGGAFGFILSDEPMPTLSARAGLRPRRSGLRPEIRGDYLISDAGALLLTVGVGLEMR